MTRALAAAALAAGILFAQDGATTGGTPVSILVSVEAKKNTPVPRLTKSDVLVTENKQRLPVTDLAPVRDRGGLQLWLLIDDGTEEDLSLQFPDLRKFILEQPATTQIGIGYIRDAAIQVTQPLTTDHERAAQALRLPMGPPGISASPYIALHDLIAQWPATGAAREVLMISNGVDPEYGPGPQDPYLDEAVDAAQRAGVIVYTIYYGGMGHFGHAYWQIYWGQYNLAEVSEDTGGEFYWQGYIDPVSLAPYLDDLNHRFNDQYVLSFLARPGKKAGYQHVKFGTELPHVSVVGPAKVYVPAAR
jgi:hypothetical protein